MNELPDRPEELSVAELIALKLELAKVRKGAKKVRAWLAILGIPEKELPELTNIRSAYDAIDQELIHCCPCVDTCAKAKRAATARPRNEIRGTDRLR